MPDLRIDPALVEQRIAALARHGADGPTGVRRAVYTPAWVAAQDEVAGWGRAAGLTVTRDAVGSVWATLPGSAGGGLLASGSHIDSQLPGGRFDGALGVIAGFLAVETLLARCGTPRRGLAAVSLCEEEGSRFPSANFWGSRAVTGNATPALAAALRDGAGGTLADAMREVGLDPARIGDAVRDDLDAFLELHIEQGPLLEEADVPVGVVTSITAIRHYAIELTGRADHAGARPIDDRRDALHGAAEIVTGVVGIARAMGRPAVTTVGRMEIHPNITPAVAGRVLLTLDTRHPDAAAMDELAGRQLALVEEVAAREGLEVRITPLLDLPGTPCAPRLVAALRAAAEGVPSIELHSGAGHDAQRMATITDSAMLFVRSQDGRSHTPDELTTVADAVAGIEVLTRALHDLAY